EYYILTKKMPNIMRDIKINGVWLDKVISYLKKAGETPMYNESIKEYPDKGILNDHGVFYNMLDLFSKSDSYTKLICKFQSFVTEDIVSQYLKENGLMELKLTQVDPEDDELDEEDENEDEE